MGRERLWTSREVAWLKENYRKLGRAACAKHLGRTIGSVRGQATRQRLVKPSLADQHWKTLQTHGWKLWKNGYTGPEIASELGVSMRTVQRWRQFRGLKPHQGKRINWARIARIRALTDRGYTVAMMAREIGCEPSSLYRTMKKQGIAYHRAATIRKRGAA